MHTLINVKYMYIHIPIYKHVHMYICMYICAHGHFYACITRQLLLL